MDQLSHETRVRAETLYLALSSAMQNTLKEEKEESKNPGGISLVDTLRTALNSLDESVALLEASCKSIETQLRGSSDMQGSTLPPLSQLAIETKNHIMAVIGANLAQWLQAEFPEEEVFVWSEHRDTMCERGQEAAIRFFALTDALPMDEPKGAEGSSVGLEGILSGMSQITMKEDEK